jgi:multiple sugar transport system substrate-binding protein
MKKALALIVCVLIACSAITGCGSSAPAGDKNSTVTPTSSAAATAADAAKYDVTKPITIEWWHALESQYAPLIDEMVKDFEAKNPNITVKAIYQGSYSDLNEKLIAAQAAGTTLPALTVANTPYVAQYGASGLCEALDPYVQATNFDINDFGSGLIEASSYNKQQVALPFLISTQVMFYNKDIADKEGITIPEKWDQMDEFLTKATKASGGKTTRYATVFPGWDQWYYEPFYLNNGVKIVNDDNATTDLDSEKAIGIANKLKGWCTDGKAYWAYGKDGSSNMRQNFIDGKAFSVIHTSSLYDMYVQNCKFNVGMAYLPGGETRNSEIGGCVLLIPSKNSQEAKNAGWKLLSYLTGKDVNMKWAEKTGYMPTRNSVTKTDEAKAFLEKKPSFSAIFDNLDNIKPRIQNGAYSTLAKVWMEAMAKSVMENTDMTSAMKDAGKKINEALQDS